MPLLRVALRDLTRHRTRTLVALLLFALPVSLIIGFASFIESDNRTSLPNPVAGYDAVVFNPGADGADRTSAEQAAGLRALVGGEADTLTRGAYGITGVTAGDRGTTTNLLALTDSTATADGPSVAPGTAVLDDRTAYVLDVGRGDTVTVDGADLTVTDIYRGRAETGLIVNAADALPGTPEEFRWYLPTGADTLWQTFSDHESDSWSGNDSDTGFYLLGSALPDSPHLIPWTDADFGALRHGIEFYAGDLAVLLVLVSVAVLVVTLISAVITPVFAVAARRLRHQLALLATNGATPAQLRRVMLYEGVVVGVVGSALGLALSAGVGAAAISLFTTGRYAWAWDVAIPVVSVALLCGVTSALVPAFRAGREDPVAALADGSATVLAPWRPRAFLGLPLIVLGVLLTATQPDAVTGTLGIALTGIGLVCSAGLVVRLLGLAAPHLPTAGRLALRDCVRNRHRTVPAVAAVAGVTMLVSMLVTFTEITDDAGRAQSPFRDTVVTVAADAGGTATTGIDTYADDLDRLSGIVGSGERVDIYNGLVPSGGFLTGRMPAAAFSAGADPRDPSWIGPWGWSPVLVTGGDALGIYRGMTTADVRDATGHLTTGAAVVGDPALVHDGRIRLDMDATDLTDATDAGTLPGWATADPDDGFGSDTRWYGDRPTDVVSVYLPAVVLPGLAGQGGIAISPATAEEIGLDSTYVGSAFVRDHPVSMLKALEINARTAAPSFVRVDVPSVDQSDLLWFAIPVLFSLLLTGATVLLVVLLAATESRRDLATVTALGAPPGLLRRFTATQALAVAGSGTLAGVVVGAAPALFHGDLTTMSGFQWTVIGVVLVAGPGLAWLTGSVVGAFSGRREGPVRRRE